MKALILAAGLGKRLRPLTLKRPKALIPVVNVPVLEKNIHYLKAHGITEIMVNTHYLHEQIEKHISNKEFGIPVHTIFEPHILGTGGAIKNISDFWGMEPFFIMNADIVTDINISKAYKWHIGNSSLATLILHRYPRFKKIKMDKDHCITEIKKKDDDSALSFTGIHILDPNMLDYMPDGAFGIVDFYMDMINRGFSIKGYVCQDHRWRDIGTIRDYMIANKEALGDSRLFIDETAVVHPTARFVDWAIVGKNCIIGENSLISRSVMWENTVIEKGLSILDSIITGGKINRDLKNIVA